MSAIEKRLAALEDEKDLRELVARYGYYADLGWSEKFVDLYTDDAIVDVWYGEFLPISKPPDVFRGKREILGFITAPAHKSMEGSCQHHVTSNLSIVVDDDTAQAYGYSFVVLHEATGLNVKSLAFRRWTFVRTTEGWRISGIVVRPVSSEGAQDAFAGA